MNDELDELIHQRNRLGILGVLTEAGSVSFTHLRDTLGLSDGNLSRHLRVLEEGELITIRKSFKGRVPQTTVGATPKGRKALAAYLDTLEDMIVRLRAASEGNQP